MTPRQLLHFAIGPIGTALLGLVTLPLSTWLFAQDDVGRLAMLFVACQFAALFFSFGLDQAYVREFASSGNKGQLFKLTFLPGFYLLCGLIITVLVVSPTYLSLWLFDIDNNLFGYIVAFILVSQFIARFLSLILRMEEQGLLYSFSQILPKLVVVLLLGGYLIFGIDERFIWLLLTQLIAQAAILLVLIFNTRRQLLAAFKATFASQALKPLVQYGMPLALGSAAYWGLTTVDKLFLKELASFEQLGLFAVAVSFAGAANTLKVIFATVWAPIVYKWALQEGAEKKISQVSEWVCVVTIGLLCLTGIFSWFADAILPQQYSQVKYLVVVCMAAPMMYMFSETTVIGINVVRKTHYAMTAAVIAFLFNCLGNYVLVPKLGAQGAALSTALSFAVFMVLRTEFASFVWKPIPRKAHYLHYFVALILACCTPYLGAHTGAWVHAIWLVYGMCFLAIKYKSIQGLIDLYHHKGKQM